MAYKALYRTYRPMTFDEVAGQEHIVKTIKNALATNKLAHAYLFAGPRGTGKTTMAKLLAKALNCDEGVGHQCNQCKNCVAINEGTHPDVIEIDAASNNGVDDVRDLIDKVKYGTILGRYKIYIIDEVHMMTTSAFNALLKTLEEPPANVIFILCTTEPHKVLPTILSRCQRYDFTKLSDEEISNRLIEVLEKENVVYNKEAVDLIVSLADGGMRDALSILDQVLAYSNNTLNPNDILSIFSLETKEEKLALLRDIASGNLNSLLQRVNHYFKKGTDIKRLTDDILTILKDLLIFFTTGNASLMQSLTYQEAVGMKPYIREDKVMDYIDAFMDVVKDYKTVSSINPLFEICVLKLAGTKKPKVTQEVTEVFEEGDTEEVTEEVFDFTSNPTSEEKGEASEEVSVTTTTPIEEPQPVEEVVVHEYKPRILVGSVEGDHLVIPLERLIELAVLCRNKEVKNQLLLTWKELTPLTTDPELGRVATLLLDARPLIANKDILVLEHKLKSLATRANLLENQGPIQEVIEKTFNRKMFVYSLSRDDSIDFQQQYTNRQQLDKLPKPNDIVVEFKGED